MKMFSKVLALAALAGVSLFSTQRAQAQVSVDVDITVDGIVILYYYDSLDITIDPAALFTGQDGTVTSGIAFADDTPLAGTAALSGTALTLDGNVAVTPASTITLTAVPLTITDAWAVRAIANAGNNVQVSIDFSGDDLVNGAASIGVDGAGVSVGAGTPAASVAFAAPGLATPTYGNVTLTLDLSAATLTGTYSSSAGSDYTLDAELL